MPITILMDATHVTISTTIATIAPTMDELEGPAGSFEVGGDEPVETLSVVGPVLEGIGLLSVVMEAND